MRKGFTLVELSIVLVIIGLLIGGILIGQSLISSAAVNAQVAQIQQFDAAVMGFKSKYKALVSDAKAFNGDGDGFIDRTIRSAGLEDDITGFSCEMANFWNVLDSARYPFSYGCSNNYGMYNVGGSSKNAPAMKMGAADNLWGVSPMWLSGYVYDPNRGNYYVTIRPGILGKPHPNMHNLSQYSPSTDTAPLTPVELLSLDQKMDDAQPYTGNVIAVMGAGALRTPAYSQCVTAGAYNRAISYHSCLAAIRIGGQTGNPL